MSATDQPKVCGWCKAPLGRSYYADVPVASHLDGGMGTPVRRPDLCLECHAKAFPPDVAR